MQTTTSLVLQHQSEIGLNFQRYVYYYMFTPAHVTPSPSKPGLHRHSKPSSLSMHLATGIQSLILFLFRKHFCFLEQLSRPKTHSLTGAGGGGAPVITKKKMKLSSHVHYL